MEVIFEKIKSYNVEVKDETNFKLIECLKRSLSEAIIHFHKGCFRHATIDYGDWLKNYDKSIPEHCIQIFNQYLITIKASVYRGKYYIFCSRQNWNDTVEKVCEMTIIVKED